MRGHRGLGASAQALCVKWVSRVGMILWGFTLGLGQLCGNSWASVLGMGLAVLGSDPADLEAHGGHEDHGGLGQNFCSPKSLHPVYWINPPKPPPEPKAKSIEVFPRHEAKTTPLSQKSCRHQSVFKKQEGR